MKWSTCSIYAKVKCKFSLLVIWLNCCSLWPKRWILCFQYFISSLGLQITINVNLFRCFYERKNPTQILPRSHLEWDFPISPYFKGNLHLISTIFTVTYIHFSFLKDFKNNDTNKILLLSFSEELLMWILIFINFFKIFLHLFLKPKNLLKVCK